jgi:hypothetical protein
MGRKNQTVKRTGSAAGFHYVNLYQLCARKFYFRYILRWQPKFLPLPLIQGSAFHEGKATWYTSKSKAKAIAKCLEVIDESEGEVREQSDLAWLRKRLPILLEGWVDSWGKRDLQEFKVFAVEKEIKAPLGESGFVFTLRPDTILQSKATKLYHIMETKTSGFSKRLTEEGVYYGDQATAYIWGVQKVMGIEVYGVQPDIAYWNTNARDTSNIDYPRTPMVTRTPYQLGMFEAATTQLMTEITQKAAALSGGFAPEVLFPRNSFYCVAYGKPCEYAMYCGKQCDKKTKTPHDFVKDATKRGLGSLVADSLAIRG